MLTWKNLNKHKELLNKINVFPIADGDTGRNLCTTLECSKDIEFINLKQYLKELSDKTLMSARGSSGNILALYIMGLSENYSDNLYEMCTKAAEFAWNTMFEPVEGTMLTAMKNVPKEYADEKDFLFKFIENCFECLFNGPDLLSVLKENNRLDSGTLGFIYILCDVYETMTGINLSPDFYEQLDPIIVNNDTGQKFCVEILLDSNNNEIKQSLSKIGSELVFLTSGGHIKIHIHVNNYKPIFELCQEYGKILEYKIEDMTNNNERIYYKKGLN